MMSQSDDDFVEWIKSLLAELVSLRVFKVEFDHYDFGGGNLPFIMELSDRAPQLEYLTVFYYDFDQIFSGKRVHGEWVLCEDEAFIDF